MKIHPEALSKFYPKQTKHEVTRTTIVATMYSEVADRMNDTLGDENIGKGKHRSVFVGFACDLLVSMISGDNEQIEAVVDGIVMMSDAPSDVREFAESLEKLAYKLRNNSMRLTYTK